MHKKLFGRKRSGADIKAEAEARVKEEADAREKAEAGAKAEADEANTKRSEKLYDDMREAILDKTVIRNHAKQGRNR